MAWQELPEWNSRQEIADWLRISVDTVDRARANGELRSEKLPSGSVRIHREWVAAWLGLLAVVLAALVLGPVEAVCDALCSCC